MRFLGLSMCGVGPFRSRVDVDLEPLEGMVVAITGQNGEGKSTLLELMTAGAMYRKTPTRGSLTFLATGRDSFIESRIVAGKPYTIRHTLDGVAGKGESFVADGDGAACLTTTKVSEFDAWAAKHLPSEEVFLASTFAAQKSTGFMGMTKGDRKGVLLRVLGIERLEGMAKAAREHAAVARKDLEVTSARLKDERARGGDVAEATAALEAARQRITAATAALEAARAELAELDAMAVKVEEVERDRADRRRRVAEIEGRIGALNKEDADIATRLLNNRRLLDRAEELRAAERRAAALDAEIARGGDAERAARSALTEAEVATRALQDQITVAKRRASDADARAKRAELRVASADEVRRAAAEATTLTEELRALDERIGGLEWELDQLRKDDRGKIVDRIEGLRLGLKYVTAAAALDAARGEAHAALDRDDEVARDAEERPARLALRETKLREARTQRSELAGRLARAEQASARLPDLEAAAEERDAARAEGADAVAEAAALADGMAAVQAMEEEARVAALRASDAVTALRVERGAMAQALEMVPHLAAAEARIAELEPRLGTIREEAQRLREEAQRIEPDAGAPPPPAPDRAPARAALAGADAELRAATAEVAVAEQGLSIATASAATIAELEAQARAAEVELADWLRLADDLGRDGLQALEIDAAGPELTAMTNDLLHTCVGPRWTVTIEASRLDAKGKKELEGCDVRVLDTKQGREGPGESFSGGEAVIVGEAISLALAMLACRRSGMDRPTIIRDETGAALDPENAHAYVAMLRRAAQIVGASSVLFVSHDAEIQSLADARIHIQDGQVTVHHSGEAPAPAGQPIAA